MPVQRPVHAHQHVALPLARVHAAALVARALVVGQADARLLGAGAGDHAGQLGKVLHQLLVLARQKLLPPPRLAGAHPAVLHQVLALVQQLGEPELLGLEVHVDAQLRRLADDGLHQVAEDQQLVAEHVGAGGPVVDGPVQPLAIDGVAAQVVLVVAVDEARPDDLVDDVVLVEDQGVHVVLQHEREHPLHLLHTPHLMGVINF
ncbi:hypothetical protein SDC9_170987 [bioreactor metagenome]|uniref:Uncharacterized protein n=1 Tax=bioreactor metagenome TaxID=1076179 RepID=A0A645GAC8_9ZZZZ